MRIITGALWFFESVTQSVFYFLRVKVAFAFSKFSDERVTKKKTWTKYAYELCWHTRMNNNNTLLFRRITPMLVTIRISCNHNIFNARLDANCTKKRLEIVKSILRLKYIRIQDDYCFKIFFVYLASFFTLILQKKLKLYSGWISNVNLIKKMIKNHIENIRE
jgi:hypothetical protein